MKVSTRPLLATLALSLSVTAPAAAAPPRRPALELPRAATAPTVDGKLGEGEWDAAARLDEFYEVYPGDNARPSQPTAVSMMADETALYVAFDARTGGRRASASLARRDQIFDDDVVGLYLDTLGDRRTAYQLWFNPIGIQADALLDETRGPDWTVDVVMTSKGRVSESGFVVEVAIPFASLRRAQGRDARWGLHVLRQTPGKEAELDSWQPISRDIESWLAQAVELRGVAEPRAQRVVEIIPSISAHHQSLRVLDRSSGDPNDPTRLAGQRPVVDAGLTVKVGLTPTTSLNLAVRPDFAQVEADYPVITANQRFPVFYPEKRPFFLENADAFASPLNLVSTRSIIAPDFAARLTGKAAATAFGLLYASDAGPGDFSPSERENPSLQPLIERYADRNATVAAARVKQDVGGRATLGAIFTSYRFVDRSNYVAAVDGFLPASDRLSTSFQVAASRSLRPFWSDELGRSVPRWGTGFAYTGGLSYAGRSWSSAARATGRSADFRADVGFLRRADYHTAASSVRYGSTPRQEATLVSWSISNSASCGYDGGGRLHSADSTTLFSLSLARQSSITVGYSEGAETVYEDDFGLSRSAGRPGAFAGESGERSTRSRSTSLTVSTTPAEWITAAGYAARGLGVLDYDFGGGPRYPRVSPAALAGLPGLDPGPGTSMSAGLAVTLRPTSALRASLGVDTSSLVRDDTGLVAYRQTIATATAVYAFNPAISARARFDYDTLSGAASSQLLFSWAPGPGTAFYFGYSEGLRINGFNPATGTYEPGLRRDDRSLFIKMTYLFRFSQ